MNETELVPKKEELTVAQKAVLANYEVDVANAMSQTDASSVQKFIQKAKDDEETEKERTLQNSQRALFSSVSIVFVIFAAVLGVYGFFKYKALTVPLDTTVSLGTFSSFSTKIQETTPVNTMLDTLSEDTNFVVGKPVLVDIVDASGTLVSPKELFTYLDIKATEPLQTAFVVARYGFVKLSDTEVAPFIVGAVADEVVATKEFLIAEPIMTALFGTAFSIDPKKLISVAGSGFSQEIVANVPVRVLRTQKEDSHKMTLLYGFPIDKTVIFSTSEKALAAVRGQLLGQQ
jgi:hypothetical protein